MSFFHFRLPLAALAASGVIVIGQAALAADRCSAASTPGADPESALMSSSGAFNCVSRSIFQLRRPDSASRHTRGPPAAWAKTRLPSMVGVARGPLPN